MGYRMSIDILYVNHHFKPEEMAAMRFDKGHKEQTRRRIIETAANRPPRWHRAATNHNPNASSVA